MDNIYKKLLSIQSELEIVAKNLSVGVGKSSYKAVGEADVLSAIKPLEKKYGVYSYPFTRKIVEQNILVDEETRKRTYYERIETIYRFVNVDEPSEYVDVTTYGDGMDVGDKSVGKAMTYADKYALMKAYKIITGDDPDQYASEEIKTEPSQPKPEQPRTQEFIQMSVAQRDTIEKLLKEKDVVPNRAFADVGITDTKRVSKQQASKLIEYLIKCPNKKQSYTTEEISNSITDMEDVRIEPKVEQNDDDDLPFPM